MTVQFINCDMFPTDEELKQNKKWYIIDGGSTFEGNAFHLSDCFLLDVSKSDEPVIEFCKSNDMELKILDEKNI